VSGRVSARCGEYGTDVGPQLDETIKFDVSFLRSVFVPSLGARPVVQAPPFSAGMKNTLPVYYRIYRL